MGGTKNKQRLAISQGCFLDRYPWNKSRIKGVTKTKLKIAPQQNIVIEPHYSQFCTWQFTYSVNFMCNPKINTCPTFTVICRHGQSGKMLSCLTLRFSAKATQGNSLPSCFSFQAVIKCLFCRLLCFLHFCALFFFFLATLPFKMVLNSAEGLSHVPKSKKAIVCLTQKISVR